MKKLEARDKFFKKVMKFKKLDKYQMSILRVSIPKLWQDVATILIKYITLEGRYILLQDSYFFLLNHFFFSNTDRVNFPYFIFNSLTISISKVQQNRARVPLHELII